MPGSHLFNLGLFQKNFNSTSRVGSGAINMGCTRGRGSTTRMFNYCKEHSPNPSLCINQFINIRSSQLPTSSGWSTQEGKLLGGNLFGNNFSINSVAADINGNIYIAVNNNDTSEYLVKKWNGTSWSTLGDSFDNSIYTIAIDKMGNIYVGGYFTNQGNYIAKWNPTGSGSWSALGNGFDSGVYAITIDAKNNVYAGGEFLNNYAETIKYFYAAKWNGSNWSKLDLGLSDYNGSYSRNVLDMIFFNGKIYMVGELYGSNITPYNNFSIKLNLSLLTQSPVAGNNFGFHDGDFDAYAVDSMGNLYVGGYFTTANGNPGNYIAKWNGSSWSALGSGLNSEVLSIAIDSTDNVYVGGYFTTAGGNPANYIAKWNGSSWSALGSGLDGVVNSIAIDSLDNLYVGGEFTNANSNPARNIAKWNPTGSGSWSSLSSGVDGTPNDDYSVVNSIAIDSANNVYVAGYFYTAGSNIINNLAKWNPSGSGSWSNLNVQIGSSGSKLYCKNQQLYITTEVAYNTDTSPGFIIWNT